MSDAHTPARIIVGLDVAGQSEKALNVGLDLSEHFGSELVLAHGVTPPHPLWPDLTPHDVEAARRTVETRLEASLGGARLSLTTAPHRLVVESVRHPAELLLRLAAEPRSLIVLGRHHRRGLLDLGSTMRAVLSEASGPVWVQAGPVRVVRRILVAIDLSDESLAALRLALDWARRLQAELVALHCFDAAGLAPGTPGSSVAVDDVRRTARAQFDKMLDAVVWGDVKHEHVFVEDDPSHRILGMQDEVDLVIMGSHGRTGLSRALLGNVALSVLRHGHVPALIVRHPERQWVLGGG